MEQVEDNGEITMAPVKNESDPGSIKFFAILALVTIGFGAGIAMFDLMKNNVFSALLGVIFIFIGCGCAMVAAAKFLQKIDNDLGH